MHSNNHNLTLHLLFYCCIYYLLHCTHCIIVHFHNYNKPLSLWVGDVACTLFVCCDNTRADPIPFISPRRRTHQPEFLNSRSNHLARTRLQFVLCIRKWTANKRLFYSEKRLIFFPHWQYFEYCYAKWKRNAVQHNQLESVYILCEHFRVWPYTFRSDRNIFFTYSFPLGWQLFLL